MSKYLFSGVLFLLVALGSGASIQCQTSQVVKALIEAIINKEQRAVELASIIGDDCIDASISVDEKFLHRYYWSNFGANTDRSYTTTIINLALLYDQTNVAEILIEREANLLIKDSHGNTALHIASCRGHKTVVSMILNKSKPQDIDQRNHEGATALHLAIYYRRADVVEELLKNFANPLITDRYGDTALHQAIDKVRLLGAELILMIIDAARKYTINTLGQTVMTDPSSCSSPNFVQDGRYILDRDEIFEAMSKFINLKNRQKKTPLLIAITNIHYSVDIVELLLENGADPTIGDDYGVTALDHAILNNRGVNIISAIITPARRQNIQNVMTDPSVWSSPHLDQDGRGRVMTRESMLKFINSINRHGKSALYLAIITSDCSVETLQCLLDNGADPWIGDDRGNTALAVALMYKRGLNFISTLITAARRQIMQNMGQNVMTGPSVCSSPNLVQNGRDRDMMSEFINLQNHDGITALLNAITKGCSVEIVELLLEHGADPRIGDALLIAITNFCSGKIVELLLENGADPRSVDSNGNTALGLASMCKRGVNFISPLITAARQQIINNLGQNVMTGPSVCSSPNLVQNGRDRDMVRESMLEFINNRNPRGVSALHLAIIFQSSFETLKILLENDADPRIPDNNGKTALDLAIQQKRHEAIIEIVNAVRNMPKLHFLQNGMTPPLYSGLIQHLTHRRLPIDVISVIFADDMINQWKKCAKNALVWAESTKRDDWVEPTKRLVLAWWVEPTKRDDSAEPTKRDDWAEPTKRDDWAEPNKRDDIIDSLRIICDIPKTVTPIDVSKQLPSVIQDC